MNLKSTVRLLRELRLNSLARMNEALLRRNQDLPPRRIGYGAHEELWQQPQHRAVVEKLMADPKAQALLERLGYTGVFQAQRG